MVRYKVTLTADERQLLEKLVSSGKGAARKLAHARISLLADEGDQGPGRNHAAIVAAYPHARKIRLVLDNLNTHTGARLYEAFAPAQARRILEKLEFHYTPKHASWLNMAEIEIGMMNRQCLDRRIDTIAEIRQEIAAWESTRNQGQAKIHWTFTSATARRKLKKQYPSIEE